MASSSGGAGTGLESRPGGHAVEPAAQRLAFANRFRLLRQDEKCCLKGILRVGLARQQATANAEDRPAVAPNQHPERGFVVVLNESLQKIEIGTVPLARVLNHALQELNQTSGWCFDHQQGSSEFLPFQLIVPRRRPPCWES